MAAARAKELNPDVHVQYLHGDVTTDLGLGVIRRMDVIIGCLDNREARLAVNRFCLLDEQALGGRRHPGTARAGARFCARAGRLL